MATVTMKNLIESADLPDAVAIQYTSAALTRTILDKVTATNHTTGSVNLTLHIVPSGGAVADANKILDVVAIAAHTCRDLTELNLQVLEAGDTIRAYASAATSISLRANGRTVA